jgi:histidine triad (HIT) family protein
MSEAEMSQEEMLEQQKANCIFCKIVKGEIPSKKVYEDDMMLAILDINPAVKGHILVLPKEHYPIMPLIPPEVFSHLFGKTATLTKALEEAMLVPRATVFIANGAIAGQQSPHFLFHIMPREDGDGLDMLTVEGNGVNQSDLKEVLEKNLYAVMRQHLQKINKLHLLQVGEAVDEKQTQAPAAQSAATTPAVQSELTAPVAETEAAPPPAQTSHSQPTMAPESTAQAPDEQRLSMIANLVQQSPEIQEMLMKDPEKLKMVIAANPELQKIFEGVDISKLASILGSRKNTPVSEPQKQSGEEANQQESSEQTQEPQQEEIIPAREMTMTQLFQYIDEKPKLATLMIQKPDELKRMIPENERLRIFFEGSNVDAIIQAYQEHAKRERGVRVTVEPEEKKEAGDVKQPKGPTREEMWEASETRDQTRSDDRLGRIGRLLR